MSSSDSRPSLSDGGSSILLIPEHERSLAQRMLLYVYNRSAIVMARQLAFWELFRQDAPDVEMSARELRAMFFGEVLYEPEHFDDLDYAVNQYINPRFNQIQLEALEFGDLAEEEDYILNAPRNVPFASNTANFEQLVRFISSPLEAVRNVQPPPMDVRLVAAPPPPSANIHQVNDAYMKRQFCKLLSELVYTSEEVIEKPTLTVQDICERVQALSTVGICLEDLVEPGMDCYKLLKGGAQSGPATAGPNQAETPTHDQVVPIHVPSSSALKRWKSCDDSGLGKSPPKMRRMNAPSSVLARRLQAKARRSQSVPSHNLM